MHCPQCQHANPAEAQFCNACGAKLEAVCPACSQVNPPGSRFCNACGHNLAQPPAPAASFASPTSYTPRHLAEKILTSRSALEGERKQVTVLFGDVADSSQLAQRTLAEALFALDSADPESAESAMLEAIRLQQVIGAKPELSRSYVSYARMLQAQGEGEKARAYLIQAIDMFRQMAMTWDLVRAEQALHSIP